MISENKSNIQMQYAIMKNPLKAFLAKNAHFQAFSQIIQIGWFFSHLVFNDAKLLLKFNLQMDLKCFYCIF